MSSFVPYIKAFKIAMLALSTGMPFAMLPSSFANFLPVPVIAFSEIEVRTYAGYI